MLERLRAWWRFGRAQGKMLEGGRLFPVSFDAPVESAAEGRL
jgi:hypothetical protein